MTPHQRRLHIDLAAARYFEAVERHDFDTLVHLWQQAAADPDLAAALHEVHDGLVEEQEQHEGATVRGAVAAAVEAHLPSATVVRPDAGPVTVGEVAAELFRHPPGRLPAEAHRLNETLRAVADPLPADLGLSKLIAWAEERFGPAPEAYWRAFRQVALRLELARASEVELQQAARAVGRKPEGPK